MKNIHLLSILSLFFFTKVLSAQVTNCTVNAGIGDGVFCAGDVINLDGNMAGQIQPGTLQWTKLSGPNCVIQNGNQLEAKAIPSGPGTYVFKISSTCASGTAEQTVTHVVEPNDNPDAGPDQTVACYPPGGIVLSGFSIPPPGTLANWEASGGLGSVQGGVFRLFPGVCFSTPKTITLTYIVENANHCTYTDTKKLTINQAQEAVFAKVFGGCGAAYSALGSCTGAGTGQWTFVGNAFGASFSNPTGTNTGFVGLTPGKTYAVRWTVTGGCAGGGSDEATFTFPLDNTAPTTADITNLNQLGSVASGGVYICGVPDSILLFGTQPNPAAHEVGSWTLKAQPCDPFLGANNFPPALQQINDYTVLVLNQGPGAFEVIYSIIDTLRGCYTKDSTYFELETPGSPITFTASFKSCGGKELSPYNYGCNGISVTNKVWDPQDVYSTYPISFRELPDPGNNLRYNLKSGSYSPVAGPPGNAPQIQGGNCLNYTLHDFEYVLALHNSAPSGTYVYNIPMVYGNDISPCGNPTATIVMEVSTPPSPANAGSDVYICDTETSLAGNTVATPQWFLIKKTPSNASNPVFSNPNDKNTDVGGLSAAATYLIGYRSYGGIYCNNFTDTVVVRTAQTSPTVPSVGSNQTNVCYDMPITLSAMPNPVQAGTSGRWRLVSPTGGSVTIAQPDNPVTTVNGLAANTTYTFEYKVKNGCDSLTATVTVTTNNTQGPSQPNAGPNLCLPLGTTSIPLAASAVPPGMTGQWVSATGNPSAVSFGNASSNSTTATVSANGSYNLVWQVSKPGCGTVTDTVLATLSAPALAKIPDSYNVYCNVVPPVTVPLTALSPAPGTGTWSLYDGNPAATIANVNVANTTTTLPATGAYRFYWTVSNGACSNGKDSIAIYVGGVPDVATVGQNTVSLCGGSNGELTLNGNAPTNPNNLGFWTVEPVSPNIMSAGIDAYLNGSSLTTPNATVRLRPGKTRLRWNIVPGPPCAAAPSVADMVVDYVPTAQIVPNEDTIHVCNSPLVTLNAISPGSSGTGTWTKLSGPSVYGLPKTQQDNAPLIVGLTGGFGVYKFRYQVTSGSCPATEDIITVVNDSIFAAPYLGADSSLCVAGTDLVLQGSNLPAGAFSVEWKKISGTGSGTFSPSPNEQVVSYGPLQNGIYVFEYKVTNGGCAFVDVIRDTVTLATPFAGADTIVCSTEVQLTTASGGKYWSAQSGNPASAIINSTSGQVSGMSVPGDYHFVMHDPATGCDDVVKVSSKAAAQITQEPAALIACAGGAGTLTVSANNNAQGMQYQWQVASAANGPFADVGQPLNTTSFAPPSGIPGLYYYRAIADNGACKDTSVAVQVQILPPVQAAALPSMLSLCPGEGDTLSISASGGQGTLSYSWQSAGAPGGPWANIIGANGSSYIVTNQTTGTFYLRGIASTAGIGCADTVGVTTVTIMPLPNALVSAAGPLTFCQGGSVTLNGSAGAGYSWQWFNNGTAISNSTTANYIANTDGNYTLQTTLDGCSSTSVATNVTVNPLPIAVLGAIGNTSICSGQNGTVQLSVSPVANQGYQWYRNGTLLTGLSGNTATVSQLGTYTVIVANTLTGCTATSNPVQVQQSQSPTASFTFPADLSICPGATVNFVSNSAGSGLMYQWLLNGQPITGATNATYNASMAGTYALVANQNGCFDTTGVVVVTQQAPPTVAIQVSGTIPECEGNPVILQTDQLFSDYDWSTSESTPTITVTQNGTYTVTVSDSEGCTNTATYSLTLFPQPVVNLTGPNKVCENELAQFTASTGTSSPVYSWNLGNTTGSELNAYLSTDFTVMVTVTDANGCTGVASMPIDVVDRPNITFEGDDPFTICSGTLLTLTAQGANTYMWSNGSSNNFITDTPLVTTIYSVIGVNDPLCPDTLSTTVTVRIPPDEQIVADETVCEPQVELQGSLPDGGQGQWEVLSGSGVVLLPNQPNTIAEELSPGTNVFRWVVSNSPCPDADTSEISVILANQEPFVFPDDTLILAGELINIQALLNDSLGQLPGFIVQWKEQDENGEWTINQSGLITFNPNDDFSGMAKAIYEVCNAVCPQYCDEAQVTLIYRRPKDDIGQTQLVTPNGDGANDDLVFDYLDEYPDNSITIFNRWGDVVFRAKPYLEDWVRNHSGGTLPTGTYYFILNLKGDDNSIWGNVLLMR